MNRAETDRLLTWLLDAHSGLVSIANTALADRVVSLEEQLATFNKRREAFMVSVYGPTPTMASAIGDAVKHIKARVLCMDVGGVSIVVDPGDIRGGSSAPYSLHINAWPIASVPDGEWPALADRIKVIGDQERPTGIPVYVSLHKNFEAGR